MTTSITFCETIPTTEEDMQDITARLFKGCGYKREQIDMYIENLEQLVEHLKTRYEVQIKHGNIV